MWLSGRKEQITDVARRMTNHGGATAVPGGEVNDSIKAPVW